MIDEQGPYGSVAALEDIGDIGTPASKGFPEVIPVEVSGAIPLVGNTTHSGTQPVSAVRVQTVPP